MYDPIENPTRSLFVAKVFLTACVMEFFGPWFRDFNSSHVFNPEWVGHARLHMMWLLGFMLFSGAANLYLIWFVRPLRLAPLLASAAWLGSNLLGFWLSVLLAPVYGGLVTVPHTHYHILGIEENVFVFAILSAFYVAALCLLYRNVPTTADASRRPTLGAA